jgi:hypothetical protein
MQVSNRIITVRSCTFAFLCVLSALAAYHFGSRLGLKGSNEQTMAKHDVVIDGLSVSEAHLKVGELWEDKSVIVRLPIRNVTAQDIPIRDFSSSCGCMQITPRSIVVPADGEVSVEIKIDTLARRPHEIGAVERPFTYEITPITANNDFRQGQRWRIEGSIRSRLTLDRLRIHFGESVVVGQPASPIKVEATVHVPVERIVASVVPEIVSIQIARKQDDSSRHQLFITPNQSLPQGDFKADVTLDVELTDGNRVFGATFPVEGVVQPEVRALPARMLLGPKKVGETATGVVVLQVPPNSTVSVEQIETDSDNLHAALTSVEGIAAGRAYRVEFKLTREGEQSAALHFMLRKSDRSSERLRVEVNAFGERPN